MPLDRELVNKVFQATKAIGKQRFAEIVQLSCNHSIIPIDPTSQEDIALINAITKAMNNFIRTTTQTGVRYTGNRANDVGKKMEQAIIEEMRKTTITPTQLGTSGYPDLLLEFNGKKVYLELKTSAQKKTATTHHRLFYFTSGKKITTDAHHLMLQIQIAEEANKYWRVESWHLRDLYNLMVGLKTEWNANYQDFEGTTLLKEG